MEENRVSITLCRYEELLDLETRAQMLIDKVDVEESVSVEDVYFIFGYIQKLKAYKKQQEERWKKISREITGVCKVSESATENTENEKVSVAQNQKSGEI